MLHCEESLHAGKHRSCLPFAIQRGFVHCSISAVPAHACPVQGQPGDLLLLAAGPAGTVNKALDRVRLYLGRNLGLIEVGRGGVLAAWQIAVRPGCLLLAPAPQPRVGQVLLQAPLLSPAYSLPALMAAGLSPGSNCRPAAGGPAPPGLGGRLPHV
jgi:hypothetical protein